MDFFTTYNFLDFVDGPFNLNHFDIQKCFPDKQMHIKIDLQGEQSINDSGVLLTNKIDIPILLPGKWLLRYELTPLSTQSMRVFYGNPVNMALQD